MDSNLYGNYTRKAAYAGKFYSGNAKKLKKDIQHYLQNAKQVLFEDESPQLLIVPHAGYIYSGRVAASGYNQIPSGYRPQRVFIIASSHQMNFPGASVYCSGNYETPLGTVTVDINTGKSLIQDCNLFSSREDAHLFEHSLEVQLPFLQTKLGDEFQLIPIIIGTNRPEECLEMAKALQLFLNADNLFIISTDFSHYPDY
jgi:AmmeMemoRadiSam system protein B